MIFEFGILLILLIASVQDIRKKEIPLWEIIACGLVSLAACIYSAVTGAFEPMGIFLSALPGVAILFIALMSGQGVGYGDGYLLLAAGPALGPGPAVMGLVIALFAGGLFSGLLVVIKKAGRRTRIPFVPFMTLGMGAMILEKI